MYAISKAFYEFNARNLISSWGPDGNHLDYASRTWSGLLKDYYLPRWELFVSSVFESLQHSTSFNKDNFEKKCIEMENTWWHGNKSYPTNTFGDTIEQTKMLIQNYI